ncbi:MAG: protein phosphatase 2C domain-containing protein [Burkholderiaceae bacterium]
MELKISVLSKPGGRAVNEDAYGVWSTPTACLCVVSDGAGGHLGGEVASKLAVKRVLDFFSQTQDFGETAIAQALKHANAAIVEEQARSANMPDMRATVLVLMIDTVQAMAQWGHIGDTRLYCFRRQHIISQTRDHSVVQSMVDAGYLEPQDLRAAPRRNILLAALGDPDNFEPAIEPGHFPVLDGDIFLLCTDGFWEYLEEEEMEHTLARSASPEAWLQQLETLLLARESVDRDNYSAVVLACSESDDVTRMPPVPSASIS